MNHFDHYFMWSLMLIYHRHGLIHPESPRYVELVAGLRVPETCL